MHKYVLLLLVLVCECWAECKNTENRIICDTFEDVYDANITERSTWTNIQINNKGKHHKMYKITSQLIPNTEKIIFNNSVNDIQDFTFAALSKLSRIEYINCDLPIIRRNWFIVNNDLDVILFVHKSNVVSLEPKCFENCTNLYMLSLYGNNISRITADTFNGAFIIKLLLTSNQIQVIEENAFANMSRLQTLILDRNLLTSFNAKLVLNKAPHLDRLYLQSNQLTSLSKNCFAPLPKLRMLLLSSNNLEDIEDGAFNGLRHLEYLDVDNNSLSSFPERAFPFNGLPDLRYLMLGFNRLNYLPRSFLHYFPNLKQINIFGNPWQCACYKEIRNVVSYYNVSVFSEYNQMFNGNLPVCVVPRFVAGKCMGNIHESSELYDIYINALKQYGVIYNFAPIKYY